jgi:hypothetical protein
MSAGWALSGGEADIRPDRMSARPYRAVQSKRAGERAADLRPMIRDLQQGGADKLCAIARDAERARRPNGTRWALLDSHPGRTGLRETAVTLVCSTFAWFEQLLSHRAGCLH